MKKPNILFIMCDQMRFDAIGCNGNEIIKTPNLDRLAASGVNFKSAYTPNPICVPARASLTTGCYPHKCTGIKDNKGSIKEGFPLLGEELNKRGYDTYAMGKLHYLPYMGPGEKRTTYGLQTVELMESGRMLKEFDPKGEMKGIEDYHDYLHEVGWGGYYRGHGMGNNDIYPVPSVIPEEHYVDTWVTDRALHHMKKHIGEKPENPFFMWASFPKPHSAFDPPRPYDRMYDPREMPDPVGDIEMLKERGFDAKYMDHYKYMWNLLSNEAKKVIKAYYYALISFQDKQIGRLLDFLEENDLREDTIVVYTTDHGDMMGDFGLYFKQNFYNGSVHIPFMISYPARIQGGRASEELAGLQDLLPTLLSLSGEPLQQEVDGKDLTPVLLENKPVRDYYISQCNEGQKQQYMVADKEWKYIYHVLGGVEELFHETEDSHELKNLAESTETQIMDVKQKMREYLVTWCRENGDTGILENNELIQVEKPPMEIPKVNNPFGRRFH